MATLNGVDLFHLCTVATELVPVAIQQNDYPGVNGVEELRLGSRGRVSAVEGYLVGATIGDVNSAEVSARSYVVDAGAYDFVDNFGNTWSNVRLAAFRATGRVMACATAAIAGGSGYCRPYQAMLFHLT